jgi:hypothetical protein
MSGRVIESDAIGSIRVRHQNYKYYSSPFSYNPHIPNVKKLVNSNGIKASGNIDFTIYREDPVGFCQNIFGITIYEDIANILNGLLVTKVLVAQAANALGKTHIAAHIAVWRYKTHSDAKVYCMAPNLRALKDNIWGEVIAITRQHPELFADDEVLTTRIYNLKDPRNFITGVPVPVAGKEEKMEATFSGKHAAGGMFFILDEGDAIPEVVYKAIDGCMTGDKSKMFIPMNPKSKNTPVGRLQKNGSAKTLILSAFDHPNVITGMEVIPGCITRTDTIQRIHKWTRALTQEEMVNPNDETLSLLPDYVCNLEVSCENKEDGMLPALVQGYRKITDQQYYYKVLGRYPQQSENQLVSELAIQACRRRYDQWVLDGSILPGIKPICGIDVSAGKGEDDSTIATRYDNLLLPIKVYSKVDPMVFATKAAEHSIAVQSIYNAVDCIGVGTAVPTAMAWKGSTPVLPVDVGTSPTLTIDKQEFNRLRDQLYSVAALWVNKCPNAMLPPDELLIEELLCLTSEVLANGKIQVVGKDEIRSRIGRSCDRLDAFMMTLIKDSGIYKMNVKESTFILLNDKITILSGLDVGQSYAINDLKVYGFINPGLNPSHPTTIVRVWVTKDKSKYFVVEAPRRQNSMEDMIDLIAQMHDNQNFEWFGCDFNVWKEYLRYAWKEGKTIFGHLPMIRKINRPGDRAVRQTVALRDLLSSGKLLFRDTIATNRTVLNQFLYPGAPPDEVADAVAGVIFVARRK